MNLKPLKASPSILNLLAIVLKLPALAGKGSSFLVVIARKRSKDFFTTTARERFSIAMCFTFVAFVFGLSLSLRSKYKDQFLTRFLRNTLPALSPVSEKIKWDTFEIILNQGNSLVVKSPWKQGLINHIDQMPQNVKDVVKNDEVSAVPTLYSPFLERLDLYNDAVVLRIKEPWDKVKNQNYIGLYTLDAEKLQDKNTAGTDVYVQDPIVCSSLTNNASGTLQMLQVPSRQLFEQRSSESFYTDAGTNKQETLFSRRGKEKLQTARSSSMTLMKASTQSVSSSQKSLSSIQRLLYKILLSLDDMPTKLGSHTETPFPSIIAQQNGIGSRGTGAMSPERVMGWESQEACGGSGVSHLTTSNAASVLPSPTSHPFKGMTPTNWSPDAPLKGYTGGLPLYSTVKGQRTTIGTVLEKSDNMTEVFLESGKPLQNDRFVAETMLEGGRRVPLLIAPNTALFERQEAALVPQLLGYTQTSELASDEEKRERESVFRQEATELFDQSSSNSTREVDSTTSDEDFDASEFDASEGDINARLQIELQDQAGSHIVTQCEEDAVPLEAGKEVFDLVVDALALNINRDFVDPLPESSTTTNHPFINYIGEMVDEAEGRVESEAVASPLTVAPNPPLLPISETKDSLESIGKLSDLEKLDRTPESSPSQLFRIFPSSSMALMKAGDSLATPLLPSAREEGFINDIDADKDCTQCNEYQRGGGQRTPELLQLFKKTRPRLMSGYTYPDLKRDEIEKRFVQLLVKNRFVWKQTLSASLLGAKEVVLPPSLSSTRFSQSLNLHASDEESTHQSSSSDRPAIKETLLPVAKIKYQDVFYSGLHELQKILSALKIEVGDDELEEMDIWELAYLGPAAMQDKATKDVIPKNKGEINSRLAALIRKLDNRALFLDRKDNFLGKKEIFWGEGISREKLQLALQARPCNALLPEDNQYIVDGETPEDLHRRGKDLTSLLSVKETAEDDTLNRLPKVMGGLAAAPEDLEGYKTKDSEGQPEGSHTLEAPLTANKGKDPQDPPSQLYQEPLKSGNLSFKDVFVGVEPKVTLLDPMVTTNEDEEASVHPVELIVTKSPSLCKEEDEIVSLEATEWSNVLKSIITHALSGKTDLDKIELLLPSITLTDQHSTPSPLPLPTHNEERDGSSRSGRVVKSVPSHQGGQEVEVNDGIDRRNTVEASSSLRGPKAALGTHSFTGDEYATIYGLVPATRSFVGEISYSPLKVDNNRSSERREPLLVCHYLPPSQVALMETSTKQTMTPTSYKKRVTSFSSQYPLIYDSTNGGKKSSLLPIGQKRPLFHEIWEPVTPTSWMILYKFCFVMWVQEMGKDFYEKYGKEIILYALHLLAALGFNAQEIIEDLGLDDSSIRVIRKVDKRFADVAGITPLLPELGEIVWFLRSSGRGGQTPKGILLVGPPGTGKTFVVQAIAGEAKVPVVVQSASALTDPNQKKSGSQKLRDLFDQARQLSPCILFIDEIDTLGVSRPNVIGNTMGKDELLESIEKGADPSEKSRQLAEIPPQLHFYKQFLGSPKNSREDSSRNDENNDQDDYQSAPRAGEDAPGLDPFVVEIIESHNQEHRSRLERLALLMQFLMEIDGLKSLHGVIVIGATNRPSVLDPAFTRPGRFEKTLCLQLPDKEKRIEILKLYASKLNADTASVNGSPLESQITDATSDPSETCSRVNMLTPSNSDGTRSDTPWDYIANRTAGLSAAHLAAAINQSSIKAIIEESGHTIETMEHGISRILNRSFRQSNVTSSLVSPKNRLLAANSTNDTPIQSENLTNQGDTSFAEQTNEVGRESPLTVDKAKQEVVNFGWKTESPLMGQHLYVDQSQTKNRDMGLHHLTSFCEGQRPPQKTEEEEEPEFGGDPLIINGIDDGRGWPTNPLPKAARDTNLITSSQAMKDKTLLQCTSHLLERLEDKGIWRILEDSLRRDEDSLPSLVEQPTMTAPSKEFGNKGADRRLAMEDVKAKKQGVVDWSSLQRFAFYQAGKAILQTELPLHPPVSFLPLEPQVFHQSTSDLSRLLSPEGAFEPQRRVMLETRLIGIYAGKAGELLGLSSQELKDTLISQSKETTQEDVPSSLHLLGAAPNQKNQKDTLISQSKETQSIDPLSDLSQGMLKKGLTLQSDLGVEELSFAGLIANHMINTWYLYSKKIASQKFNLAHVSQDENEIEIDDPVLLDVFRHLEKAIEDETRLARRTSFMYQHRFAPAWWQTQIMTEESLVEPNDSDWYRLYIPDPEETERNIDWVAPDDHYHAISANLLRNTSRTGIPSHFVKRTHNLRVQELFEGRRYSTGSAVTWNDFYLINHDYIYQALVSNCLHKAINLLDRRRELLDLFADQLLRYNLLRQHEIGSIWKQFNVVSSPPRPLAPMAENSQEEVVLADVTSPPSFQAVQHKAALEDLSMQSQPDVEEPRNPGTFSEGKRRKEVAKPNKGNQQISTPLNTKRVRWGSYSRRETARFVDFDFVKPCFFKKQDKEKQGGKGKESPSSKE